MWNRKNKSNAEQGSAPGRRVDRSGGASPAFSYYTSKPSGTVPDRLQTRADGVEVTGRKTRVTSRLPLWLFVGLIAVCLIKVVLLGTAPKVIVVGSNPASVTYAQSDEIYATAAQKILSGSIANRSKLTVDLNGTARALERQFPELQAVSLGVPLIGSRPIIYVQVARPSLVLQAGGANYALNKTGIVLARSQNVPTGVPVVVDQSAAQLKPGKQYLPSSTVTFIQTVAFQMQAAKMDISVFTLPTESPYEIDVRFNGKPYYVRFNLQADALMQSGEVVATLQQLNGKEPGAYLDVRVPGRVYYK